jgi:hypothetical protein
MVEAGRLIDRIHNTRRLSNIGDYAQVDIHPILICFNAGVLVLFLPATPQSSLS